MAREKQVIEASRAKVILLIALCLGFVAAGVWILLLDPAEIKALRTFNNTVLVYGLGILNVGFFGLGTLAGIWRLFSRKPALELSDEGINIFHIGSNTFVPWSDVSGFSVCKMHRQKMLAVHLHTPSQYIQTCSKLNSYAARANYNLCNSPVVIAAHSLKISFEELCELCEQYFQQNKIPPNLRPTRSLR